MSTGMSAADAPQAKANGRPSASSQAATRPREAHTGPHPWVCALHAMRLQWPWIVFLGIPLSAVLAYTAWTTVPTPFTAYVELLCQPRRFFWETKEDEAQFSVYKQTMMRRIKDPQVIAAAMRKEDVAKTKYARESIDILEQINQDLVVSSPAQEFIRIELRGPDPKELNVLLKAIVDSFQVEVIDREQAARKDRLDGLRKLLTEEEDRLKSQREALKLVDQDLEAATDSQMDLRRQAKIDEQLEIRREMAKLHPQIIELELLLGALATSDSAEPAGDEPRAVEGSAPESAAGPLSAASQEELSALLMKDPEFVRLARTHEGHKRLLDEWRRRVNGPHREIERLELAVDQAAEQLARRRDEIEPALLDELYKSRSAAVLGTQGVSTRAQLDERLKMLKLLLARYDEQLSASKTEEASLANLMIEREQLTEQITSLKSTVDIYAQEVRKLEVELAKAPPPIVVSPAGVRVPVQPDQKKRYLATIAGAGGGVGLVAALLLLLELSIQRIFESSQIRTRTNLPLLGTVPLIPPGFRNPRTAKQRLTATYWRDVLQEAFDGVQSIVRHNERCAAARTIMVASSCEGEGKSTSAAQLALSFARAGYRVLLIDGDLRRPSLEKEFGIGTGPGLCEVLDGRATLDQAICHTELQELDLLLAGQLTDKVRGMLARDEHAPLFRELSQQYSFVFVDSAPVLASADTMSLAKHVDGVVMVVRKDVTRLRRLEASLHRFEMIGVPMLGLLSLGIGDSATVYTYNHYSGRTSRPSERESGPPRNQGAAVSADLVPA